MIEKSQNHVAKFAKTKCEKKIKFIGEKSLKKILQRKKIAFNVV